MVDQVEPMMVRALSASTRLAKRGMTSIWLKASDTSAHLLINVRTTKTMPAMPTEIPSTDVTLVMKAFFP